MDVMPMPSNTLTPNEFLVSCKKLFGSIKFVKAQSFYWSPRTKSVHYDLSKLRSQEGKWALLHETAHAELGHSSYPNDFGLLLHEVAAWAKAHEIAKTLGITIDTDHVEDCLDTYREWLYARSTCPTCSLNGLQISQDTYSCINCLGNWRVSKSRFCRPYRLKIST
ncbi:MAG: hypothetical protein ABI354_01975 [Candidatus Saccharimonadales bacterium]